MHCFLACKTTPSSHKDRSQYLPPKASLKQTVFTMKEELNYLIVAWFCCVGEKKKNVLKECHYSSRGGVGCVQLEFTSYIFVEKRQELENYMWTTMSLLFYIGKDLLQLSPWCEVKVHQVCSFSEFPSHFVWLFFQHHDVFLRITLVNSIMQTTFVNYRGFWENGCII